MKRVRLSPAIGLSVAALVLLAGGAAYAAASSSSQKISACVQHKGNPTGGLYLAGRCHRGDKRLVWNVVGPKGPQGTAGPRGTAGPQGIAGPATGPAGGVLTGNYPNPGLATGAVASSNFATGATAPNAAELGGVGPSGYVVAGNVFLAHGSANLSGVISPAQQTTPLGSVTGLGSFTVGGANAQAGDDCRITFTNTSGGVLAVNGNANPGLSNGSSIELAGVDARPAGATAPLSIMTPEATETLSGTVTVTFGFPGAGNVDCAGSISGLVNR